MILKHEQPLLLFKERGLGATFYIHNDGDGAWRIALPLTYRGLNFIMKNAIKIEELCQTSMRNLESQILLLRKNLEDNGIYTVKFCLQILEKLNQNYNYENSDGIVPLLNHFCIFHLH